MSTQEGRAKDPSRSPVSPHGAAPLPGLVPSDRDPSGTPRVELITEFDRIAALHASWNELMDRGPHRSVFFTHEWFEAAWQWRQQSARLFVLCLFRGHALSSVLPLVLLQRGREDARVLEFLTVPDTQLCDVLVSSEDRGPAAVAFADELVRRRGEWDALRLDYLHENGVAATDLRKALMDRGCASRLAASGSNPYIDLRSNWAEYYSTRGRRLKKACNLASNRLKKLGAVQVDWFAPGCEAPGGLDRAIGEVIEISARSWKTRTGNSLDNPGPQAFIRRLSRLAHERGWLSLWLLRIDGKPVAMEYQLVAWGEVFALRSDFDGQYEEASPGSHLNRQLLEPLFGQGLGS